MKGYVYVISNKGMPDLIKVGFSTKDPHQRAKELSGTGSPHPYKVEYEVLVNDPYSIEQTVHRTMNDCHEAKEWFRCTVEYAIIQVQTVIGDNKLYERIVNPAIKPIASVEVVSAETLFNLGVVAYRTGDYAVALDNFQKSANQSNAQAQFALGYMYENGLGLDKNESIAVEWFQKSAEQGHIKAQNHLSLIHEKRANEQKKIALEILFNLGMAAYNIQNYVIALDKFQNAANQGNAKAQYKLGVMYDNGYGIVKNERTAVDWYTKAAEQGHAPAQCNLGIMYANGYGVVKNERTAVDWYTKAAEQGHAPAQFNLGVMYATGRGVIKNERTAVDWYTKAAEQGYARAQYNLGVIYDNGHGVFKNERTVVDWYTKAAEQGHAPAQYNLGVMYAIGRGVIKNERTAVDWYTKAAKQGYAVAQKNLLLIHKKNIKAQKEAELQKAAAAHQKSVAAQKEVEFQKVATEQEVVNKVEKAEQWFNLGMAAYNIQNYVVALDKFQKAANQGSAKAQYKLGVMYNNGYGIVKNERTAVEWFQKAADQGDAHAQYNLSLIHEKNIKSQKEAELQKAAAAQKVVNQAEQLKQDTMTKTKVYISSNHKENDISNNWWLIIGFVLFCFGYCLHITIIKT